MYYEDKKLVKHVLKFENLHADFSNLMKSYALPIHLKLHRFKSNFGLSVSDLTPSTKKLIYAAYKQDFDAFGYKP